MPSESVLCERSLKTMIQQVLVVVVSHAKYSCHRYAKFKICVTTCSSSLGDTAAPTTLGDDNGSPAAAMHQIQDCSDHLQLNI